MSRPTRARLPCMDWGRVPFRVALIVFLTSSWNHTPGASALCEASDPGEQAGISALAGGPGGVLLNFSHPAHCSGSTWSVYTCDAHAATDSTHRAAVNPAWTLIEPHLLLTGANATAWLDDGGATAGTQGPPARRLYTLGTTADDDGDSLSSSSELLVTRTDPNRADTDGDAMPDGWEVGSDFDPLDASDGTGDADDDGLSNQAEHVMGSNPRRGWTSTSLDVFHVAIYQPGDL
jgi:hypothetical protein